MKAMIKNQALTFLSALLLSLNLLAADMHDDRMMVNINTATMEELDEGLVGVGEKTAMEIVAYRKENGPFKSLEDLDKVKYVGARMLEKNKDRITFE